MADIRSLIELKASDTGDENRLVRVINWNMRVLRDAVQTLSSQANTSIGASSQEAAKALAQAVSQLTELINAYGDAMEEAVAEESKARLAADSKLGEAISSVKSVCEAVVSKVDPDATVDWDDGTVDWS